MMSQRAVLTSGRWPGVRERILEQPIFEASGKDQGLAGVITEACIGLWQQVRGDPVVLVLPGKRWCQFLTRQGHLHLGWRLQDPPFFINRVTGANIQVYFWEFTEPIAFLLCDEIVLHPEPPAWGMEFSWKPEPRVLVWGPEGCVHPEGCLPFRVPQAP